MSVDEGDCVFTAKSTNAVGWARSGGDIRRTEEEEETQRHV